MATMREITDFIIRLHETAKEQDVTITFDEDNSKNYVTVHVEIQGSGNAVYSDSAIIYNGDPNDEYPENVCKPEDFDAQEVLTDINNIFTQFENEIDTQQTVSAFSNNLQKLNLNEIRFPTEVSAPLSENNFMRNL